MIPLASLNYWFLANIPMGFSELSEQRESRVARANFQRIERHQWWISSSGVLVTLILTLGIVSFALPVLVPGVHEHYSFNINLAIRALIGLVLLFDLYVIFQQYQIHRFRIQLAQREELFRLI